MRPSKHFFIHSLPSLIQQESCLYLFLVMRKAPVLNKKNRQPAKRMTDKPAVTHSKAVKKLAVRLTDADES
jgi:hypothetical protein